VHLEYGSYLFDDPGPSHSVIKSVQVIEISIWLAIIQGIALGIFRFNEPMYVFLVQREFRSWFGLLTTKDK
jgi:hypothetical protein